MQVLIFPTKINEYAFIGTENCTTKQAMKQISTNFSQQRTYFLNEFQLYFSVPLIVYYLIFHRY